MTADLALLETRTVTFRGWPWQPSGSFKVGIAKRQDRGSNESKQ